MKRVANHFIDMHTGGDRFRQLPFVFYTVKGKVPPDRYDTLARGFGIPTLWRDTDRIFADDATTVFSDAGILAFLLEVGGGQPLDPADIRMQMRNQSGRRSAEPNTTNRGSRASPTNSWMSDIAAAAVQAAATELPSTDWRVRGRSGSPKPYAVMQTTTA